MKKIFFLFYFILCIFPILGMQIHPNYELADKTTWGKLAPLYQSNSVNPFWLNNSGSFLYGIKNSDDIHIYFVNAKTKKKVKLDSKILQTDDHNYQFTFKETSYVFHTNTQIITNPEKNKPPLISENISPDQKYKVFVKNHNLFIKENQSTNKPLQISIDGERFYSFKGTIDYVFTNEHIQNDTAVYPPNINWSPNSDFFMAFRTDGRMLKDNWVINSLSEPRPQLTTFKQRNPGEPGSVDEVWIFQVKDRKFIKTNLKKWENENYWYLGWSNDGKKCYFQRINQKQDQCDIIAIDKTGNCQVLIEERPDANIFTHEFRELSNGDLLWFSRRDGWGHLFLYGKDGKTVTQITKGKFNVERVISIDLNKQVIYFLGNGKDKNVNPYYSYLYSVNMNSKKIRLLTPENGDHEVSISPDHQYYIDTYSRVDQPHTTVLSQANGKKIMELEKGDNTKLKEYGWQDPEMFIVKAADNKTDLWGVMWKPFDFDPNKKYPIITYVYPGPQHNFVPTQYFNNINNTHLAQYGFIVVMCDSRGSSYQRSKKFSEYFRTHLRDYPLEDNKYMIEQLAKQHSFIDINKVGIWGGSSGGYMAASAMMVYPDFYKVGVSRSAQHDPNIYHGWWSDIFNSPPNSNDFDSIYTNSSIAKNLKGKLFIIHGEVDANVHPAHSARLANELMKAGKYFDYLVVPGGGHGWSHNWPYVQKRIWLYFVDNLMLNCDQKVDIFEY